MKMSAEQMHWMLKVFQPERTVATVMRGLGDPIVDLYQLLDASTLNELLMEDGLHFTQAGQQRIALEILRSWCELR